jgi:hypothetical protein
VQGEAAAAVLVVSSAAELMAGLANASVTEMRLRAHVTVGVTQWSRAQLTQGGVVLNNRLLTLVGDVAACGPDPNPNPNPLTTVRSARVGCRPNPQELRAPFRSPTHAGPACRPAPPPHTAMKKLRIVILGFGTARQKRVLE